MKMRKVIGSFLNMPWIPLLDDITDACEDCADKLPSAISWLIRPCCKPAIGIMWFYGLGEVRMVTSNLVERIKVVYYKPHQDEVRRWYVQWPNRLLLGTVTVAMAYWTTFYVYPTLILPHVSMSWLIEEKDGESELHTSYISTVTKVNSKTGEEVVYTLVSKSIIKCVSRQSEVIVWVLGALLNLPRKRFLPIWITSKFLTPIAEGVAESSGNFALWMSLGLALSKMFQLYPNKKEKYIGTLGTTGALLVTSFLLPTSKKIGRTDIVMTSSVIVIVELGVRYAVYMLKQKTDLISKLLGKKKGKDAGVAATTNKKPGILKRIWRYFTYDEDASLSSSWPAFTYPSYEAWIGLVAAWASCGIALDGV